ncbi:hypothetical protein AWB78_06440 [Caballeronia calidae]|uniref:Uncharacterized protein n=1 Tax=Caballeronia calidae TaxID=1777139 RepID=A0A158E7K9_9BURK|nr:hypothetical protein [Caballeronia calidae]SAL02838.1 hypothetical protein AWB78_06440 [Caballeronia calidae]
MENAFNPALVQFYVDRCLALGTRNQAGEDVSETLKETVDEAFAHFDNRGVATPVEHKRRFAVQLRTIAGLLGQSMPLQAKILMDAYVRASAKLTQT